jgi:hypothetical protein
MSTFIIETISKRGTQQITDLEVVCLMPLFGLALTAVAFSLGFGADVVRALIS